MRVALFEGGGIINARAGDVILPSGANPRVEGEVRGSAYHGGSASGVDTVAGSSGRSSKKSRGTAGFPIGAQVIVVQSTSSSPAPLGATGVVLAKDHGYIKVQFDETDQVRTNERVTL
jgi:hypothetical protein